MSVKRLPVEIWHQIFLAGTLPDAATNHKEPYAPLLVCSYFRNAALSCPTLWTCLVFTDSDAEGLKPHHLKYFLSKSKNAPLYISIYTEAMPGDPIPPYFPVLAKEVRRWESLEYSGNFTELFDAFVAVFPSAVNLSELTVDESTPLRFFPLNLAPRNDGSFPPNLKRLDLSVGSNGHPRLGGPNVTHLELYGDISFLQLLGLLGDMPRLTTLKLAEIMAFEIRDILGEDYEQAISNPPNLKGLKRLEIDDQTLDQFGSTIDYLLDGATNLEEFTVQAPFVLLRKLIPKLPPTLTYINITTDKYADILELIIHNLPKLQTFYLDVASLCLSEPLVNPLELIVDELCKLDAITGELLYVPELKYFCFSLPFPVQEDLMRLMRLRGAAEDGMAGYLVVETKECTSLPSCVWTSNAFMRRMFTLMDMMDCARYM